MEEDEEVLIPSQKELKIEAVEAEAVTEVGVVEVEAGDSENSSSNETHVNKLIIEGDDLSISSCDDAAINSIEDVKIIKEDNELQEAFHEKGGCEHPDQVVDTLPSSLHHHQGEG